MLIKKSGNYETEMKRYLITMRKALLICLKIPKDIMNASKKE